MPVRGGGLWEIPVRRHAEAVGELQREPRTETVLPAGAVAGPVAHCSSAVIMLKTTPKTMPRIEVSVPVAVAVAAAADMTTALASMLLW